MDVNQVIQKVIGTHRKIPLRSIYQQDWLSWYRGKVLGFHNYRIYNGERYLDAERKTLGMAKMVAETWAGLLLTEKCDIILPKRNKEVLDRILQQTNFWDKMGGAIEKSFALGIGALVVDVVNLEIGVNTGVLNKSKAKIKINFVNATKIKPITVDDKQITECAFVSKNTDSTNIVVHTIDSTTGNYVISNFVLDDEGKIAQEYTFATGSPLPWFVILRPNIESNIMTDMNDDEIGISVYANRLDTLRAIDNKYDGFDAEFILNRPIQYVSAEAVRVSLVDGEMRKTFDPMETRYYHLPNTADGNPMIETKSNDIRFLAYIQGINAELNYLAVGCGLGEHYYKFDGSSVATATQVISENSTLYRNIKKHENLLHGALVALVRVLIYASGKFTNDAIGEVDEKKIVIQFDDSIIEDKESEMRRDREDVAAGLMSKVEYRMRWYGEDEKTASDKVRQFFLYDLIDRYTNALVSGVMTPEQFVEMVYPTEADKPKLIEYITEFLMAGRIAPHDPYNEDPDADEDEEETPPPPPNLEV